MRVGVWPLALPDYHVDAPERPREFSSFKFGVSLTWSGRLDF